MDEIRLMEKLRLIEALFAGTANEGEKVAADQARQRILERLKLREKEDPPVEYKFTMGDMWSRKVFVALLRRYGVAPFRYRRQRYTTVMASVSKGFVDETLWPEFQEISETLRTYLSEVTERVVSQVIHQDSSEAEVVDEPRQLPLTVGDDNRLPTPSSLPPGQSAQEEAAGPKGGNTGLPGNRSKRKRKKHKKRKRR